MDVLFSARKGNVHVVSYWEELGKWADTREIILVRSTWKIELRIDIPQDDEQAKELLRTAMRNAAQIIYAQATLMCDRHQPQIAIISDDHFDGEQSIKLFSEDNDV